MHIRASGALCVAVALAAALLTSACLAPHPASERAVQSDLHVQLARAYLAERRVAVALSEIQLGLELNPKNAEGHYVMSLIQQHMDNREAARQAMHKALALQPHNPRHRAHYATLLCRDGEYEEALALFDEVNSDALNPTPAATRARAGGCRMRAGDLAGAVHDFERALALRPAIPEVLLSLAELEHRRANYELAQRWLQQYFALGVQNPPSLQLGMDIARALGDEALVAQYQRRLQNL